MPENYANKLHERYVKQRERLLDASLETAGRYDRALLTVGSGALAISVAFLEKIAPSPVPWTIAFIVLAWTLLLASIISQLLALDRSENATKHQVSILDTEYLFYFSGDDPAERVREGFIPPVNPFVDQTKRYNLASRYCLISGIVLVFVFSALNLWIKGGKEDARQRTTEQQNGDQG